MKEFYEKPELKINEFKSVDVLTDSTTTDPGDDNFTDFGKESD